MTEPIIEFKTQEELDACLKEWQERLFLTDWTIKAQLKHIEIDGVDVVGYCEDAPTINAAIISLTPSEEIPDDAIVKTCMEKTLVHELLHCVYPTLELPSKTIESALYESNHHAMIEKMAKSLIMAKYGISFDWFKNF